MGASMCARRAPPPGCCHLHGHGHSHGHTHGGGGRAVGLVPMAAAAAGAGAGAPGPTPADLAAMRPAQVGIWLLNQCQPGMGDAERLVAAAAARDLMARPAAEPLSLAMVSWALATGEIFEPDLFRTIAARLAGGVSELVALPRAPEAIANTCRAFAKLAAARGDQAP